MSRPFLAIVPRPVQSGDKITLKGKVKDGADEFSINFANETCPNPLNISYHFKTIIPENLIVENCKKNGEWMDEQVKSWPSPDGPSFALEFAFQDDGIYVYMVDEDSRNLVSYYEHECDLNDIESVQVWGDVDKINEITFQYS